MQKILGKTDMMSAKLTVKDPRTLKSMYIINVNVNSVDMHDGNCITMRGKITKEREIK